MPFQYAIEEIVPRKGYAPEKCNRWNSDPVYHIVPKEVAETDENGMFSILNNSGKQVSEWIKLNSDFTQEVDRAVAAAKSSSTPHEDYLGEELAVGDYVSFSTDGPNLCVGKVVSFTPKKVRIIDYCYYYAVVSKNPSGLAKIHPDILSD